MPINYTQDSERAVVDLKRLTTEYIDIEDRIRLTGEIAGSETVVLWLTQRLLTRLLPHLLDLLQQRTAASVSSSTDSVQTEMVQTFSQQAARSQIPAQEPVRQSVESQSWLVESVDVVSTKPGDPSGLISRLTFKGGKDDHASIPLPAVQLRQWMNILHDQWKKANWPMTLWPDWVRESVPASGEGRVFLH